LATNIRDNLELVLAGYDEARSREAFGGKHELWGVFDILTAGCDEDAPGIVDA
jgi:hypothetical protein